MRRFTSILGAVALASIAAPAAQAAVLDFSGNICTGAGNACGNGGAILATYGDIAGVIDVQYDRLVGQAVGDRRLSWWDTNYNDLRGVAWGGNGDSSGTAEIFLNPLNGQSIRLLGFDLGAWLNASRGSQFTIKSGAGTTLFSSGPITVGQFPGNLHNSYNFNIASADGIRIQWGPSAFNVGIDNIEYEQFTPGGGVIPEPSTWALMIGGFGLAGAALRRRRLVASAT